MIITARIPAERLLYANLKELWLLVLYVQCQSASLLEPLFASKPSLLNQIGSYT